MVNKFVESVTLPLARWYQEVLGMASEGMLGTDRQKLAILLCLLIKNSYGHGLMEKHSLIWDKKVKNGNEREEYGVGLKDVINEYGFSWLSPNIFNWQSNNFALGVGERFPFPIRSLEKRYQAQGEKRKVMVHLLQEIDQVTGRIQLLGGSTEDEWSRIFLIRWMAMRIIKQYHEDVWVGLYQSSYDFVGKEKERERQQQKRLLDEDEFLDSGEEEEESQRRSIRSQLKWKKGKAIDKSFDNPPELTYASVRKELGEELYPCKRGRHYLDRRDIFELLFFSHFARDNGLKQGWKRQAHLHGLKSARIRLEEKDYGELVDQMRRLFDKYCLCIPTMSKDRWLAQSAHSKLKPTWIGFNENGERMDYPHKPNGFAQVYGSTWYKEISIHKDYYWKIQCEEATSDEGLRRGRQSLKVKEMERKWAIFTNRMGTRYSAT
jgi:hypothetical protein